MKSNNGVKAGIILFVIAALIVLGIFGLPAIGLKSVYEVRTGIDIQGGISVTLEPANDYDPTQQQLETARAVIERRLDSQNVFDRNITIDTVGKRIMVEIPYKSNAAGNESELLATEYNAQQKVVEYLGKTAELSFRPVDEDTYDSTTGAYAKSDIVYLTGDHVEDAQSDYQDGGYVVTLKFDSEGTKAFATATSENIDKPLAIWMDDDMLLAPNVDDAITSGSAIITGMGSAERASLTASQIRSGSMPFKLEASELTQITPLLGDGALTVTVQAGLIAFVLVLLFMLFYYRLPGFIAMVALVGLLAATLVIMAGLQITLTLPGIAGIILSIGMSIDANIIISERIKEELNAGRTLKAAIDAGFRNAFAAIVDSNVTTIISAVVLYILGSGAIRGFAVTLALGVLLSFLSVITVSHVFLRAVTEFKFARGHKLYGAKA